MDPVRGEAGVCETGHGTPKVVGGVDEAGPIFGPVKSSENAIRIGRVVRRIDSADRALAQAVTSKQVSTSCNFDRAEHPEISKDGSSVVRIFLVLPHPRGEY